MKHSNDTIFTATKSVELFTFLTEKEPHRSRNAMKSLLTHRQIVVNNTVVTAYNHLLQRGDEVKICSQGATAPNPNHKLKFAFEDGDLIIVDKKVGLLDGSSENSNSALGVALEHTKRNQSARNLYFVHHLEREISGLLLFAKNEESQAQLAADKSKKMFKRTFVAVVEGKMQPENGKLIHWLKQKEKLSKTVASASENDGVRVVLNYKTLKTNDRFSLVEVATNDDFRHQIRAQLAANGTPVAGDKKYGATSNPLKRICLHATKIAFYHPKTGKKTECESAIPKEFL